MVSFGEINFVYVRPKICQVSLHLNGTVGKDHRVYGGRIRGNPSRYKESYGNIITNLGVSASPFIMGVLAEEERKLPSYVIKF